MRAENIIPEQDKLVTHQDWCNSSHKALSSYRYGLTPVYCHAQTMLYPARDDQGAGTRAHIYSMYAHVCHPAPAVAAHLPCPLPCRELQSFTSAVVIRDAVCRCLLDHYFHQLFRRFKAPAASQGTTNPRLLPPSRATAAFTARSGQRVAH